MEFDFVFMARAFVEILPAAPTTLAITASAIVCGLIIAVVLAYARYYEVPVVRYFAAWYVSFFRGTPIVMHFFLVYYGLPHVVDQAALAAGSEFRASAIPLKALAVIALTFSSSSYFAEILRAGMAAVARGEIEAAHATGMTHWQIMRRVILPQTFAFCLPNLGSRCIGIMHSSSLAFWIAVVEITAKANLVAADTYQFMEAFIAAAAIYWLLTLAIERLVAGLESLNKQHLGRGLA